MKTNLGDKVKTFVSHLKFAVKKRSPEILISVGVVGVVASTVMACISTTKVKGVIAGSKKEIQDIHNRADAAESDFTENDKKKALTSVYLRTGVKLVKLYAPSVILGTLSLTSVITSNNILRKRNVALAAAYTAVDKGFKNYRANVVERFGEDVDRELKYGIKTEKITEKTTDPETGKQVKTKKEVKVANLGPEGCSEYARYFDSSCMGWTRDMNYNRMFLKGQENFANDMLRANGYLFLNEVYDELGIPRSKAGQVVGWIYDKDNPEGDNYVSFGIFDTKRKLFEDGDDLEDTIILDFNVDGYIMDRVTLTK